MAGMLFPNPHLLLEPSGDRPSVLSVNEWRNCEPKSFAGIALYHRRDLRMEDWGVSPDRGDRDPKKD